MRRPFSTSGLRSLLLLGIAGVLAGCGETESDFQKKVASAKDRRASLLLEVELHESIIRDAKSRLSDVASLRTAQDDARFIGSVLSLHTIASIVAAVVVAALAG